MSTGLTFITANGLTLHYAESGRVDGLALVFANSLGTDFRTWDGVVPHFADECRIIRYDKRGHGLSDCPPAPYRIEDHADDLVGLLDALNITSAVIVGISVGGQIAMNVAIRYPERVKAAVFCDTAAKIGTDEMWNTRINTLREQGMAHIGETIVGRWFAPSYAGTQPAAYRGYLHMLARTPVEGYIGTCESLRDADMREAVTAIKAKTLVICGAEDAATTPELVRAFAESLPDSQFQLIEGAGHLPCVEQPDATANAIRQFLRNQGLL